MDESSSQETIDNFSPCETLRAVGDIWEQSLPFQTTFMSGNAVYACTAVPRLQHGLLFQLIISPITPLRSENVIADFLIIQFGSKFSPSKTPAVCQIGWKLTLYNSHIYSTN